MPAPVYSAQRRGGESVWPHRLALLTACATFPLLFVGGLVTSKGAGLAVPDWPTTFGHNMFLFPWSKMVGDIFYEHSHRLVASGVGLLTIALALMLWFRERRVWLRWLGVAALGLVVLQGVIGGLRVVLLEQTLAILHAGFAQAFFALTVCLAFFTSNECRGESAAIPLTDGGRLPRLCALTTGLIYLQSILGAVLRHTGGGPVAHFLFAGLVSSLVILVVVRVAMRHTDQPRLLRPALTLGTLLLLQLVLGVGSFLGKFTPLLDLSPTALISVTTTHLVVGALMLATGLILTLRSYRSLGKRRSSGGGKISTERFST